MTPCYTMFWDLTPRTRRGTTLGRRLVSRLHYVGGTMVLRNGDLAGPPRGIRWMFWP